MKKKLILDYDNTVANYTKAFCEAYNKIYYTEEPLDWTKVREYDFKDVLPKNTTSTKKYSVMGSSILRELMEYYDDIVEIVNEIAEETQVTFVSYCGVDTVKPKFQEIRKTFPKCDFIPIIFGTPNMTKNHIDMRNSVFIDDRVDILKESDASVRVCMNYMGYDTEWSRNWDGLTFTRWRKEYEGNFLKLILGLEYDKEWDFLEAINKQEK